jgi:purine-binding chemotaxis protein CheW
VGVGEAETNGRGATSGAPGASWYLVVRCGSTRCALPAASVVETMRPLPIEPLAGAPAGVRGVSRVRGEAVPVVDLGAAFGSPAADRDRMLLVRAGARRVGVLVDDVEGVRRLGQAEQTALPPLLSHAADWGASGLAVLDQALLVTLSAARLVPDGTWEAVSGSGQ